jgi:ribosomal protein S18 acetylase RimI-like enzyme
MSKLGDAAKHIENETEKTLKIGVDWTSHAALAAYEAAKDHLPMPNQYKDLAMVSGAIVLGAVTTRQAAPRLLRGALTEAAEAVVRAEDITIVPLTRENLPSAIKAGKEGFRYGWPVLNPAKDFRSSLAADLSARPVSIDPKVEMNARYWLAVDKKGNVLGTTGLYETSKDQSEAAWLGWMSVRPTYRGQGIGGRLMEFSINQARADGKKYLRLYTSNATGEKTAQGLYKKLGLEVVGSEPHPLPRLMQRLAGERNPLKILYRELELGPNKPVQS